LVTSLRQIKGIIRKDAEEIYKNIHKTKGKGFYERLKHLNLWTLEERRNRLDLIDVLGCTKEWSQCLQSIDSMINLEK